MGKLAVAGITVVAGGGTAVGGVVLSKMFSFDSTLSKDLDEFKKGDGGGCIKNLFPGLKKMDGGEATTPSSSEIKEGFLSTSDKEKGVGCLIVNWDKDEYGEGDNKNGKGNFRLLWAVQQNDKGFIVFTTANTTDGSDKKLLLKGVAYSIEKEDNKTTGKFSKKKEVNGTDKKIGKDDVDTKFPKANTVLTSLPFGGLIENKDRMDKVCGTSDCQDSVNKTSTSFEGYWQGKGASSGNNLGDGISSLSEGWKELFGENEWNMSKVVENMTGKWENKVWHGIVRP